MNSTSPACESKRPSKPMAIDTLQSAIPALRLRTATGSGSINSAKREPLNEEPL